MNTVILARDVYERHSATRAADQTVLACTKGCSKCCEQLVPATRAEWEPIDAYLWERQLHARVFERAAATLARWSAYKRDNWLALQARGVKAFEDWLGTPCIFLNGEGGCDVYAVRPMACRTLTSTVRCDSHQQARVMRFRANGERELAEEIWASGHSMALTDLFLGMKG